MKKKSYIKISILALILLASSTLYLYTQSSNSKSTADTTYTVAHVLNSKSLRSLQKYIYKDTRIGVRRIDRNLSLEQKFLNFKSLTDDLFKQYDAVVIHSTGKTDTLEKEILSFANKHSKNPKLIVVAYLPRNKSTLTNAPKGIDIVSSASRENPAKKLIINTVSPQLVTLLK